jgi:hypothetical protein
MTGFFRLGMLMVTPLILMGILVGVLLSWRSHQRLGEPGVRVAAVPFMVEDRRGTNEPVQFVGGKQSVLLPSEVAGYRSKVFPVAKVVWDWLPKDTVYGQRNYVADDGFWIQNTVVLMGRDRTSIHQPQYCLQGSGWQITGSERISVKMNQPVPYELPMMKLAMSAVDSVTKQEVEGVFIYWFVADGQLAASHSTRMWWMAKDLLTEATLQRWAYVICFAPCPKGYTEKAQERILEFIRNTVPQYQLTPTADKPFAVEAR